MNDQMRTAQIRDALRRYINDGPSGEPKARAVAAKHGLLPILMDWTAFVGLSPEGEMKWVNYDAPHDPRGIETTEAAVSLQRLRHLALIQGAGRYPELAFLRPERTSDSVECPSCHGTGVPLISGKAAPHSVVCECGGLGWIPAEWK